MERERIIALLAGTPSKVYAVVAPLSEEQLRWRPNGDEWSAKEVLCHLRDTAEVHSLRMQRIAAEDNPFLPSFDQEAYARDRKYQEDITPTVLLKYIEQRGDILAFVRGLSQEAWSRPGAHEEDGAVTLQQIAERMVGHESEHLGQLRRLRAGLAKSGR